MSQIRKAVKCFLIRHHLIDGVRTTNRIVFLFKKGSILRTLYYNFKLLPFRRACSLPMMIGKRVKIRNKGIFHIGGSIEFLSLKIGIAEIPAFDENGGWTVIHNEGEVNIEKESIIHPGAKLWVRQGGCLKMKGYNVIGANSFVASDKKIEIGLYSGCSWDCEIFDTDFHYMRDVVTGDIFSREHEVVIGRDVFIGNHVNISKGTIIPDGSVVSSWSNVSGNFSKKGSNLLIGSEKSKIHDEGFYIAHGYMMIRDNHHGYLYRKTMKKQ